MFIAMLSKFNSRRNSPCVTHLSSTKFEQFNLNFFLFPSESSNFALADDPLSFQLDFENALVFKIFLLVKLRTMKTICRKRLMLAMAPERLEHYLMPTMENQLVCLVACALAGGALLSLYRRH